MSQLKKIGESFDVRVAPLRGLGMGGGWAGSVDAGSNDGLPTGAYGYSLPFDLSSLGKQSLQTNSGLAVIGQVLPWECQC